MTRNELALVARVVAGVMRASLPLQFKGVFKAGTYYYAGNCVTRSGSLWHCNKAATTAVPGDGSPDWTLAVKRGEV